MGVETGQLAMASESTRGKHCSAYPSQGGLSSVMFTTVGTLFPTVSITDSYAVGSLICIDVPFGCIYPHPDTPSTSPTNHPLPSCIRF